MITQLRIGLRLHRFEVIAAVIATGILAASAIIVRTRLDAIGVPMSCWDAWFGRSAELAVPAACNDVAQQFLSINENEAGKVVASTALLPLAVGLFLGVPLIAREIEGGTAPTVWTLAASRARWFAGRLLPLLIVLVVTLGVLAIASDILWSGREPWYPALRFGDAGLHGPVVVGKGLAAFGMAVLLGAIFGRVLPAIIVGAVLCVALFVGWGFGYQWWTTAEAANHRITVEPSQEGSNLEELFPGSGYVAERVLLPDGQYLYPWEAESLAPAGVEDPYQWVYDTLPRVVEGVPGTMYPTWSAIETATFSLIGIGALLVAFPVVGRRRPM